MEKSDNKHLDLSSISRHDDTISSLAKLYEHHVKRNEELKKEIVWLNKRIGELSKEIHVLKNRGFFKRLFNK
jgi:predicted  nucleic acid-binding Zn-ribbon protein